MFEIQSLAHSATYIIQGIEEHRNNVCPYNPIKKYVIELLFLVYNVILHLYFRNKIWEFMTKLLT